MWQFLIVDDNHEQAETVQTNIEIELAKTKLPFHVNIIFPYENTEEYFAYFSANDVCVLIIDEKLNAKPNKEGVSVDYMGHDLVSVIRGRHKDLPIYTITGYSTDAEVLNKFSEYEYIIGRKEFYAHADKYVPLMVRAATKFVDRFSSALGELTQIAQEIAAGESSPEKLERLQALQLSVELPIIGYDDRKKWLEEYESHIAELEELREELARKLI